MAEPITPAARARLAEFAGLTRRRTIDARATAEVGQLVEQFAYWYDGGIIWDHQWQPDSDRNHLALVLRACEEKRLNRKILDVLWHRWLNRTDEENWHWSLLTDNPEVVCRCVLEVIDQKGNEQ